jgi:hypothetical protein
MRRPVQVRQPLPAWSRLPKSHAADRTRLGRSHDAPPDRDRRCVPQIPTAPPETRMPRSTSFAMYDLTHDKCAARAPAETSTRAAPLRLAPSLRSGRSLCVVNTVITSPSPYRASIDQERNSQQRGTATTDFANLITRKGHGRAVPQFLRAPKYLDDLLRRDTLAALPVVSTASATSSGQARGHGPVRAATRAEEKAARGAVRREGRVCGRQAQFSQG